MHKRATLPPISEKEFQGQVEQLAKQLGWAVHHHWLSIKSSEGWPDLVLIRPPRLLFRELKTDTGQVTAEQQMWLDWLRQCRQDVGVWRPRDWHDIEVTLR